MLAAAAALRTVQEQLGHNAVATANSYPCAIQALCGANSLSTVCSCAVGKVFWQQGIDFSDRCRLSAGQLHILEVLVQLLLDLLAMVALDLDDAVLDRAA